MGVERVDLTDLLGPSPGYAYVATASRGTHIYTAGAVPLDPGGNLIGADNPEEQTRAVIHHLNRALEGARASAADVVKTTIYVVGQQDDLRKVWRVFAQSPLASAPSTLVGVTALGYEGQLVEIEAVAVLGERG